MISCPVLSQALKSVSSRLTSFLRRVSPLTVLLLLPVLSPAQTFVQVNNNTVDAVTATMNVTYSSAETAGDLNVVIVGWSDTTASVTSVVDDNTNTYVLAGTTAGNGEKQAIYYARNIVLPNSTTPVVTVNFNQAAAHPDVRILEYSGLSTTAPLDIWGGASGASTLADSGSVTTSASDLLVGAGTTDAHFTAAGTGFTSRSITVPFGDIVEDSNGAQVAGSYNATGVMTDGDWVMQVAAFSTTAVTFTNAPVIDTVTPIAPTSGPDSGGTAVTITGTNFQPGAVVLFGTAPGGISGVNCTEAAGTTITCLTPPDSDGAVDVTVVNVDGQLSSAAGAYTFVPVIPPTFTAVNPTTGPTNGAPITVTGTNFQNGATVAVGGLPANNVVVQNATTITAITPGLPVGPADVTVTNPDGGTVTGPGAYTFALGTGPINYIQGAVSATPNLVGTASQQMTSLQHAGNLNVVIIGWADATANLTAVTDTEGNTYTVAGTALAGTGFTQVIYYAKNIVGDTATPNQITATFNQPALAPDMRILEYSGLDPISPLDTTAGNAGSGNLADTGACTTTTPVELIVAGATVGTHVTGAGSGFNLLALTQPNGDNAEHQITAVAGSCEATTPIFGSANYVTQVAAFKLTQDFGISALPASRTVTAGSPASYTVSVTALNGFTGSVTLTCNGASLPSGATCDFVPSSVTPGTPSTLTINTDTTTPAATSSVTVTGTAGLLTHNTSVGLTVNAPPPVPDFTIAASALAPASIVAGGTATSTITIAPLNSFTGTVALSCSSITPVVTPAPTCAFVPPSVAGGSGTSVLTVTTSATTPANAYTVTVAGAGSTNHSTTVHVTVTPAPAADFTIAATALTPASVAKGGTATSTITIAPTNGFNSAVSLSCSVTPAAAKQPTCTFSPTSVAGGSGTSTLTVKTTAATTASVAPHFKGVFYAMWLPVGGLALLGAGFTSRKKRLLGFLLGCLLFSGLIFMAACGGSSSSGGGGTTVPGTPAGAYTVTVTGTSASLTHTAGLTLTVQ